LILSTLLGIYIWILIARLLLSWFPRPPEWARPIYTIIFTLTEPVLRPVRGLLPPVRMGMTALDLSPIIVFVVLRILLIILQRQGL
jgi:YggT family protein